MSSLMLIYEPLPSFFFFCIAAAFFFFFLYGSANYYYYCRKSALIFLFRCSCALFDSGAQHCSL